MRPWALVLLLSAHAWAADDGQARTYFNAGAQAFAAGQFQTAIRAFEQAYRLSPKPGVLFSLGQAERRQFVVDRDPAHLERAVSAFRRYVDGQEQGTRRLEAIEALAELEPMLSQSRPRANAAAAAPAPPAAPRIMVTSPTPGATVTLDNGLRGTAPFIRDVDAGSYQVEVSAEGFESETRAVPVTEGDLVAIDVSLRELPALVDVLGPREATVYLDGQQRGILPLEMPLTTTPGEHRLGLLLQGREGVAEYVVATRGETTVRTIGPKLSILRLLSLSAIGVGAASLLSMVGVSIWTNGQANEAKRIFDSQTQLSLDESRRYTQLRAERDSGIVVAGSLFLGGLLFEALGLVLFAVDSPRLPEPKPR